MTSKKKHPTHWLPPSKQNTVRQRARWLNQFLGRCRFSAGARQGFQGAVRSQVSWPEIGDRKSCRRSGCDGPEHDDRLDYRLPRSTGRFSRTLSSSDRAADRPLQRTGPAIESNLLPSTPTRN